MPTSLLENIPGELLARVCEYVGFSHRPSLLSFALASKRCHSVAKRLFFHTIRFSANSRRQLELDVGECIRLLERNASFSDVRILLITGRGRDEHDGALTSAHGGTRSWSFGLPLSLSEIVDGDRDRLQGLERRSALVPTESHGTSPDIAILTETAWQPLARLVQILQGLGDVLYSGPSQVPPCLLQALLQCQPRCRLHVFTFTLRSLHLSEPDPDKLALVTAPCLYSIWMWYCDTNGLGADGQPGYHAEAVYSMVRDLAPNLKEVHLFQEPGSAYDYDGHPLPPCPPWKGFTTVGEDSTYMPAQLESLELELNVLSARPRLALDKEVVDSWTANTKLSFLRALRISRIVTYGALRSLIRAESFPCLTTLLFTCAEEQEHAYYDDVKQFVRRLPRLTSLEVIAWPPSIYLAAALPHGLRELWLRTQNVLGQSLDEAAILELAARCPRVETLALKIRRSRGGAAEVALYKGLGRFANLRRLVLTLDASPVPWFQAQAAPPHELQDGFDRRHLSFDTAVDPSFDESDRQYLTGSLYPYRHGHVRDVLIDTAVDETLARAIFRTVCAAKASAYGCSAALALERVMIRPEGGRSFPHQATRMPVAWGLRPYLIALGRRWLLERDVRDDARQMIHAREIDKEHRLRLVDSFPKNRGFGYSAYMAYMPIFRRIWPERPGASANWYDDWHSWSLAETT
ncbi:hypothetical protein VTK56DRAFT_5400 [Thermocarpiscus australiensis]